jgi:hypothetical protein
LGMKINVDRPQDLGIQNGINSVWYVNLTTRNVVGDKRVRREIEQNISHTVIKVALCCDSEVSPFG